MNFTGLQEHYNQLLANDNALPRRSEINFLIIGFLVSLYIFRQLPPYWPCQELKRNQLSVKITNIITMFVISALLHNQLKWKDNTLPKRSVCLLPSASARLKFFELIVTNSFRPECGNWSDESELMVERSAFWLEGILLVSVMVVIMLMLMTARMLLISVTCSKGRECFFSNCLLSSSTSASLVKSTYRCKG